jgi:hypothetical protein
MGYRADDAREFLILLLVDRLSYLDYFLAESSCILLVLFDIDDESSVTVYTII